MSIYSIISDKQEDEEFSENLASNMIGQKFLYFGKGAEMYYAKAKMNKVTRPVFTTEDYVDCIEESIKNIPELALISLGCGNLEKESNVVKYLSNKHHISLFGVDSSQEMLQSAVNMVANVGVQASLRRADITTSDFKRDMESLLEGYPMRIYTLLGSTFANVDQKKIISKLFNLLNVSDFLWLDVALRKGYSPLDDAELYNRLLQGIISKQEQRDFYFAPLKKERVNMEDGDIVLDIVKEAEIGSIKCIYSFQFKKDFIIEHKNDQIPFKIGEKIVLQIVRYYDQNALVKYVNSYGFELVNQKMIDGVRGQFLFRKKS